MKPNQLSQHFTLEEMTRTSSELNNTAPWDIVPNGRSLCGELLEPLRVLVDSPLHILSGFRTPEVNSAVGGSPTSDHLTFLAADFYPTKQTIQFAWYLIVDHRNTLPFKQAIIYPTRNFIHISLDLRVSPKRELLVSWTSDSYEPWKPSIPIGTS